MGDGTLSAGSVSLGVKGDAKGFGAKLAADIKGQGSVFSDLGKHVGGLITAGLGLAGIGVSIGAIFKTGFEEASDASAGIAQLAAGIKSTGNAAHVSVDGMTALASSIQDMSGQTDDSIVKAEQLLLTFTNIKNVGPNKIFDQATQAAADMAAKMGGDASQNAILLGKALNDPAKGLTALMRVGVSFTAQQREQIAAMMKSGDVAGAQSIILKELQTEFGGAAKAAGETLPGMLARGKRAFEDMSQTVVETLLPIVMPAISGVSEAVKKASPYVVEFAKAFSEKLRAGIEFIKPAAETVITALSAFWASLREGDVTSDGLVGRFEWVGNALHVLIGYITGSVVPGIKDLVKGFQDGTGAGGAIRDVVDGVWSVVKMLGEGIASLDIPGKFRALIQQWQDGTGAGGALKDVAGFLLTALSDLGTFLSSTLVPGVQSAVEWIGKNKDVVRDVAAVIGVVLLPVLADLAVKEVASAATSVATWITKSTAATTGAATEFAAHYTVVAGWIASGAAAVASGAETVAIWAMYKIEAIAGAAQTVGSLLVVAGGWIATAATATASGIAMAAAWIVGLGPIGWIIGAIVAVGAAFVVLYNKVGWFRDGVNAAWAWIKEAFSATKDWLINAWNSTVDFFSKIPARIGAIFGGIASFITAPFRLAFNGIATLWNNTVGGMNITVPSWVPGIGGKGFSLPHLPTLAEGATVMPTPGGTVVRVAEAGKAESIVDTGKLNNLLDKVSNEGAGRPVQIVVNEAVNAQATAYQVVRMQTARGV